MQETPRLRGVCYEKRRRLRGVQKSSTRDVQDGVGVVGILLERVYGLGRRKNEQLDSAALGFELYVFHHRQTTMCAGTDHQPLAFPRDVLFNRQRRVSELVAKLLGRLLLPLADFAAINYHVIVVGGPVDTNRTKGKIFEAHMPPPRIAAELRQSVPA